MGNLDMRAWAQRVAPLWLVWVLYLTPVGWLWSLWLAAQNGAAMVGGSRTYDEYGNLVGSTAADTPGILAELVMVLSFGYYQPVPVDVVLLSLGFAATVLAIHLPRVGRRKARPPAAVGALLAAGPVLLAVAVLAVGDSAVDAFAPQISATEAHWLWTSTLRFVVPAMVSVPLGWILLRIGWGPPPSRVTPGAEGTVGEDSEASEPFATTAAEADADHEADPVAPAPSRAEAQPLPEGELEARGWDRRPELPADFRAPAAGASPYERPSPTRAGAGPDGLPGAREEGADPSALDPLAAYRRPRADG